MAELSRREFAEAVALAALAPLLGPAPGATALPPLPLDSVAGDSGALARALADAIRALYGDRLSAADLTTITRQIEASLDRAAKVRRVPLANGDEPDVVFSAVRAPTPE